MWLLTLQTFLYTFPSLCAFRVHSFLGVGGIQEALGDFFLMHYWITYFLYVLLDSHVSPKLS